MGSKVLDQTTQKTKQTKAVIEVYQLNLGRGKKKQGLINRKVQNARGYPTIQIPKTIFDTLTIFLNSELYVEYSNVNPLQNEIKIRLYNKPLSNEQLKQRHSQSKR